MSNGMQCFLVLSLRLWCSRIVSLIRNRSVLLWTILHRLILNVLVRIYCDERALVQTAEECR